MDCLTRPLAALPEPLFSDYEVVKVLGVGAYAIVHQVRHKKTKEDFALKVIEKQPMIDRLMLPQLQKEVAIVKELAGTPHVVQLLGALETKTHFFLRFELCTSSMEDVCKSNGAMTEEVAYRWLKHACLGVKALHAGGIIHRDLKPSNFLVDAEGNLCICDFGFACKVKDARSLCILGTEIDVSQTGITGTPHYSSPETQKKGLTHTEKVDIYGLGACMQHFLLGRCPESPEDMPKGVSQATLDLLEEMLSPDPQDRPTIDELVDSVQQGESLFTQWFSGWQVILHGFSGK